MTWAQRLKRVFNIDIETCSKCGGDQPDTRSPGRESGYRPVAAMPGPAGNGIV